MDAGKADAFEIAAMMPEPGAPFTGANSFTERKAVDRIEKAGFTTVAGLKKDVQGIWRATGKQGGKPTSIADAIEDLITAAESIMAESRTTHVTDAGLISSAQAVEHYEISRYGTL